MMAKPTPKEIADKLVEFREVKERYKQLRTDLAKMAVEFGMEQKDAIDGVNASHFLDGVLVSTGVQQAYRKGGAA